MNGYFKRMIIPGVLLALSAAFLFTQCGGDVDPYNPKNSGLIKPVEELIIQEVVTSGDGAYREFRPVIKTDADPLVITGIDEARYSIQLKVVPPEAHWEVDWVSTNPQVVWYDHVKMQVVGNTQGDAKLTFTTKGKKADGKPAVAELYVKSTVVRFDDLIRWNFSVLPEGWVLGTAARYPPDIDYADRDNKGYSMLLYSSEVRMAVYSGARLRLADNGRFGRVEGIQGPYDIRIEFTAGGTIGSSRYPTVTIGSATYNTGGSLANANVDGTLVLEFTHNGTGTDPIVFSQTGGIYISEIRIVRH